MSHVFGFLPKAKQEVITEFGLDKAYVNDKKDFIKDLLAFKDQLYSRKFTPEEINGIVIFVRGEQPKADQGKNVNPQDEPYGRNVGWKIHLRVKPINYMYVYLWLKFNCVHGWKHLAGGDPGEKDFTIYTGSYDNTAKLAKQIKQEIEDKIEEPRKNMLYEEITVFGIISLRFNCPPYYKGVGVFHPSGYGWLGIPTLSGRVGEMLWNKGFKRDFEKRRRYWIKIFVEESIKRLLLIFNDSAKRRFLLGTNDVVLKVIENNLKILPD